MSQIWLLKLMGTFKYKLGEFAEGECEGLANMAMQAFLADDMDTFNRRIALLQALEPDQMKQLAEALGQVIPSDTTEEEKESLMKLRQKAIDTRAFLDGIAMYQSPDKYSELLRGYYSQSSRIAQKWVVSKALESPEKQPFVGATFCGAYDVDELVTYLKVLQTHLSGRTSLLLQSCNHAINLNFVDGKWILVNANELPAEEFHTEEASIRDLAQKLILGFNPATGEKTHAIFDTRVLVRREDEARLARDMHTIQANAAWIALNENRIRKAKITDGYNGNLLYSASKIGDATLVSQLLDHDADPKIAILGSRATPIMVAASEGHDSLMELFARKHRGVMMQACSGAIRPMDAAAGFDKDKVIKKFHELGFDLNEINDELLNPVLIAAEHGQVNAMRALVEARADLNVWHYQHYAPAYLAAKKGHYKILDLLSQGGADFNLTVEFGRPYAYVHIPIAGIALMFGDYSTLVLLGSFGADLADLSATIPRRQREDYRLTETELDEMMLKATPAAECFKLYVDLVNLLESKDKELTDLESIKNTILNKNTSLEELGALKVQLSYKLTLETRDTPVPGLLHHK